MNENEHFWVTNLAFEGGGSPGGLGGGDLPPRLIHLCEMSKLIIHLLNKYNTYTK